MHGSRGHNSQLLCCSRVAPYRASHEMALIGLSSDRVGGAFWPTDWGAFT